MAIDDRNTPAASDDESKTKTDENFADNIGENDPHKVEKLASAGKNVDAAEASE